MKPKLLLIILACIQINLSGQDYIPFNFENGIWICDWGSFGDGFMLGEEQYYCNGDTLIEGNLYYKLYYFNRQVSLGLYPGPVFFNGYYGAIRNLENKQVEIIAYDSESQTPEVIYDFNLTIGDTIKNGYGKYEEDPLIVLSIDSVEFCGKFHKRFNLNDSLRIHQQLIEGIGFNSGFMNPVFRQFEQESSLKCYTERNSGYCEPCDLLLSKKEVKPFSNIEVFPNPNSGVFNIRSDKYIVEYYLLNQMGQIIYSEFNLNNMEVSLRSEISAGIYFLKIKTLDQNIQTKKIVIN